MINTWRQAAVSSCAIRGGVITSVDPVEEEDPVEVNVPVAPDAAVADPVADPVGDPVVIQWWSSGAPVGLQWGSSGAPVVRDDDPVMMIQ